MSSCSGAERHSIKNREDKEKTAETAEQVFSRRSLRALRFRLQTQFSVLRTRGIAARSTWVLGLPGFRVENIEGADDSGTTRLRVRLERHGRRYPCSGCGRRISRVRSMKERTWDDLPWAAHPVTLMYPQRRVVCRRCGIRTERIEFADAKARVTRRVDGDLQRHHAEVVGFR